MSTVAGCIRANLLIRIGGNLRPHQQPTRILLATKRAIDWMKECLPMLDTDGHVDGAVKPIEQAGALFNRWVSGEPFRDPLPHEMEPLGAGVWEVRTADLRFFGWFPEKGMFVISAVNTKESCLVMQLYRGYYDQTLRDRAQINLNAGSYLTGTLDDLI